MLPGKIVLFSVNLPVRVEIGLVLLGVGAFSPTPVECDAFEVEDAREDTEAK